MLLRLGCKSLWDRKGSVLLSMIAVAVSVFVLLGVEHLRHQVKANFSGTVSGVDLIVGPKTGPLNLLLYSVFRIGNPTNNISWQAYERLSEHHHVKWAIPLSLGDSHKGFRVLGTSTDYFTFFSYGQKRTLQFAQGRALSETFDMVLGADVAKKLGYQLGESVVLSHGVGHVSFTHHEDWPFEIVGVLAPTGTPVDQTVHVLLEGIEAIHGDHGSHELEHHHDHHAHEHDSHETAHHVKVKKAPISSLTAMLLGLESKTSVFQLQREINQNTDESLLAILPGMALAELWQMMSVLERSLLLVSVLVFAAASLGLSAMLLAALRERRQEIQLLRVIGASPSFLFGLIQIEAVLVTLLGILLGVALLSGALWFGQGVWVNLFGLHLSPNLLNARNAALLASLLAVSGVVAIVPALSGYRSAKRTAI